MNVKVEGGDAGGSGGAVGGADVVADVGADAEVGHWPRSDVEHDTEYALTHLNLSSDFMYVKVGGEEAEGSREGADVGGDAEVGREVSIR